MKIFDKLYINLGAGQESLPLQVIPQKSNVGLPSEKR